MNTGNYRDIEKEEKIAISKDLFEYDVKLGK